MVCIMYVELHQYERLIETQTSRLYFKDNLIYKVKKKVSDNFISYLSRENRIAAIEREFSRGVKYSPRLYRAIIDVQERDGSPCEPAICMNYLGPHYTTLFSHLRRSSSTLVSLDRLLQKIKAFHTQTRVYKETDAVTSVTMEERFQLLLREAESLGIRMESVFIEGYERFIAQYHAEYPARLGEGYIRELHGDLHTDNILFCDDDFILFDFLDFEESFTAGDVAIDLGFLVSDFCSCEEIYNLDSLLSSIDNLFNIELKTLLPLVALGLLNRANTFQLRADYSHLSGGCYRLSTSVMEKYLRVL
jgi:aminoglycoside phosphotransferase family enzyme